jgi:aryl-alcohol dehydrogenase-like predicted oxidoreductase
LNRDAAREILPFCLKNSIGVINYSPMAAGLLAGKMSKKRMENLPADDWRRGNDLFREPKFGQNLQFVDHLRTIARDHSCSVGEVAIAWTLANPAVTAAIVGMRRPDQVDGIIRAADIKLTEKDLQNIEQHLPVYSE